MSADRAVITGTGAVAPQGASGIDPLEGAPPFGCPVQGFNLKDYIPTVTSYIDRCSALALAASQLALKAAGRLERESRSGDWGLAYATAWGCLDSMELFFAKVADKPRFAPPLIFSHSYANSPSSIVCIEFGLCGTGATFSQGATGALVALGWARDRLERTAGAEVEGVLVAASDSLSKALRRHYAAAGALSPEGKLAPLEQGAGGTVLGEAGAALTLELEEAAGERGANVLAAVLGWGSAGGEGALARAIRAALAEAGTQAGSIAAVYTDASGRPELDAAGAGALSETVGDAAPRRAVKKSTGECGPAAGLLSIGEICREPAGVYLVTALDPSGGAAALILERAQ